MGLRDGDDRIGVLLHIRPAVLRGKRQHVGPPGAHLQHVGHGLVKQLPIGPQGHHQRAVLNQADGAVFEFPGGVGLGVDVGDLLELQGALQAQGVVHIAANKEHAVVVEILRGEILDIVLVGEDGLHLPRQQEHLIQHRVVLALLHRASDLSKVQRQQVHHRHLGGVRLGGSHGDLRPGPGVEHLVGLPGDGAAHHIDDGEDAPPQPLGLP